MRILDRYILKSILIVFFSCLFIFIFLYIIIDLFSHLDEILKNKAPIELLIKYYLAYIPIIFIQVSSVACLISTLYTFGNLNRYNEIIAMRASGLNIFSITKTAIIFGLILSLFIFWLNDKFLPLSLSLTQKIKEQIEAGRKKVQNKENIDNLSIYGLKNRLFFINTFSIPENTLKGITILEHDEKQNITKKIVADKGIYKEGLWKFYRCIIYEFDENGQMKQEPQYFEEIFLPINETPQDFLTQKQQPEFMNISQLDNYIWKLSKSGATKVIRNLKVDLYQRFTSPFNCLIMILLGIPFSLKMKRRAMGLASFGLAMMVGFLYYVLNAVSIAFGKAGFLFPFLASSFSQISALLLSLYLINRLP